MALSQKLEFRQSQSLVMTPQLMQAIKLLQLSNLDLSAYVDNELEQNPLLERASETEGDGERRASENAAEQPSSPAEEWPERPVDAAVTSPPEAHQSDGQAGDDDGSSERPMSAEAPLGYSEWGSTPAARRDDGDFNLEAFVSAERTLADHLAEQLALAVADPARRMIGQYLIDLVDEAGYLTSDLETVADKLGTSVAEVGAVLATLQSFDPAGVCARNLAECLAIQLKERDRFDPAMRALVDHIDLLAKRDLAALRRACGVDEEDLADMVAEIRQLNPKPGLALDQRRGDFDAIR
jgi:RNA polymerase sigma-54 factor